MSNFVVTIERGFGSGGRTVGKLLAQRLDINYYNDELIRLASEESGINIELFGKSDERVKVNLFKRYNRSYGERLIPPDSSDFVSNNNLFNYQAKIIRDLADKQSCVLIGRCADYILKDHPANVRVLVYADRGFCIRNVTELYGLSPDEADNKIQSIDKARASYYKYYTDTEWGVAKNYHISLDSGALGAERCVEIITEIYKQAKE